MKVYDLHSDIFSNLYLRTQENNSDQTRLENGDNVFFQYHLSNLTQGNINGGIWVIYSDDDFDIVKAYQIALKQYQPYQDQFDVIYGLEGLRNVLDLNTLDTLYHMGIRHASLTWNEENHLATGVKGDPDRGLTDLGYQFLTYMKDHQMIVDLSHLNEKSFYQVLATNPSIVIASHSNCYALHPHPRNLKDEQLIALKAHGGKLGLAAVGSFIATDPDLKVIDTLIDHIDHAVAIMGIDNVMLGLDMMDFLGSFSNSNLKDLANHSQVPLLIEKLQNRGYDQTAIAKIAYLNFLELIKKTNNI